MRLSGLVVAAILLASVTLLAQHSSGGSSSGGSSHSGSGYSGGSSSSAASHVSSASSHNSSSSTAHVASTGAAAAHPSPSSKMPSTKENAAPEKKGSRSFFHPFRKPKPVQSAAFKRPCLKEPCMVCPPGGLRNGKGACGPLVVNACQLGQSWNGFACGAQGWFSDCRSLAEQLAAMRQQMVGQVDAGQSLRYRLLQTQYEQCLRRFGSYPFSAYLLDTP